MLSTLLELAGLGLVVAGCALVALWLALVVAGVGLVGIGFALSMGEKPS